MSQTPQAYLVGGSRTPVGRYGGALSSVRPDDLAALVIKDVVEKAGLDPAAVDEVILGNANGPGLAAQRLPRHRPRHHRQPPVRLGHERYYPRCADD